MTEEEFNALAEPVIEETETPETPDTPEEPQADEQTEATYTDEQPAEEPEEPEGQPETTQEPQQREQPQEPPRRQMTNAQMAQQAALEQEYRAAINKVNPFNGKVVQTPADFFEYKRQQQEYARQHQSQNIFEGIKNGTASQADFDRYIQALVQNNPVVQASRQMAARFERREAEDRKQKGAERLQADIDTLNREYPACNIKKASDINGNPEIISYLRRGLSIADAYYLTHRNEMIEAQKAGVRQAVVNQANGKKHLQTTASNTQEEVTVSEDEIRNFKNYLPDWKDEKIVEYLKQSKRRN